MLGRRCLEPVRLVNRTLSEYESYVLVIECRRWEGVEGFKLFTKPCERTDTNDPLEAFWAERQWGHTGGSRPPRKGSTWLCVVNPSEAKANQNQKPTTTLGTCSAQQDEIPYRAMSTQGRPCPRQEPTTGKHYDKQE